MHPAAYKFVAEAVAGLKVGQRILEIGSRNVNGSVRPLFKNSGVYVGLDIAPGPDVDVVADAACYDPVAADGPGPVMFDTVVCCEVLEHTPDAALIVRNAFRLLRPDGGIFIMTCAGDGRGPHSAVDGGPLRPGEFYRNVSRTDFERWAAPFGHVLLDTEGTDLRAICMKAPPGE